jgi:hypothetical protein
MIKLKLLSIFDAILFKIEKKYYVTLEKKIN